MNPAGINPATTTIVIKHGTTVTSEFLMGQPTGFPPGEPLSPRVIRQAIANLRTRNVQAYEDGSYHSEVSRLGMYDLVALMSCADAQEDFHSLTDKKGLVVKHLGIRWTVSDTIRECRIFGPKSDPQNQIVIDLTAAPTIQDPMGFRSMVHGDQSR